MPSSLAWPDRFLITVWSEAHTQNSLGSSVKLFHLVINVTYNYLRSNFQITLYRSLSRKTWFNSNEFIKSPYIMDLPYPVGNEMNIFFLATFYTRASNCLLSIKERLGFLLRPLSLVWFNHTLFGVLPLFSAQLGSVVLSCFTILLGTAV